MANLPDKAFFSHPGRNIGLSLQIMEARKGSEDLQPEYVLLLPRAMVEDVGLSPHEDDVITRLQGLDGSRMRAVSGCPSLQLRLMGISGGLKRPSSSQQ